jgi:hypothetical protein
VSEHALPRAPKSADRIDGAMIAGGDMAGGSAPVRKGLSIMVDGIPRRQWEKELVIVEIDCDG